MREFTRLSGGLSLRDELRAAGALIEESKPALAGARHNRELLRTLHAFLARTYFALNNAREAA